MTHSPAAPEDIRARPKQGASNAAFDVIVIGGGIVGLSTAYFLARRGMRVILLEKGRLAWEQSSRNWGFVRQQGRDPAELPMAALSNRIWCGIEKELDADMEWRQGGNLAVAHNEDDLDRYAEGAGAAQAAGIDTRVLTPDQVGALLPAMQGRFAGGLYTPSDGQADPLKATLAFAKGARAAGADLREHCAVNAIHTSAGRASGVATDAGDLRGDAVVCAAGSHSGFLGRMVGLRLPLRSMRATVAATTPLPPLTGLGIWSAGLGLRQARDGSVILGRASAGTAEHDLTLESLRHINLFLPIFLRNRDLFRLRVGMPLVRDVLRHLPGTAAARRPFGHLVDEEPPANPKTVQSSLGLFNQYFPQRGQVGIARAWAGMIDATPDLLPVLGEVQDLPGFFFATGFSGHGFGLGPGAGHTLAELIALGRTQIDIRPMRYERFAQGDMSKARKIL
ncbi:MAG: FAD-binding oxidoreductase [Betaproteobacteria bacterium]|nr:FAD-binding oxidoreductase [Betaproteobacteria bacterium]